MNAIRRTLTLGAAAAIALLAGAAHAQEAWPSKPIKLVIPTAAGGAMDAMTRAIAEKMTESLKQPVVVDNRAGGNGAIAYSAVANSPPDGYTVGLSLSSLVQTPLLYKSTSFNLKDVTPIVVVAMLPNGFAVAKDVPASNLAQFVEWARTQPAGVDYGSSGTGSSGNIMGAALASAAKIEMLHVPFKGEAPAIQAVMGPKPVADKLAAEITRIVRLPDISARISALGFLAEGSTPEAARQFFDAEWTRWGAAIKASKITLE